MHNPKFNSQNLLAIAFIMWCLTAFLFWIAITKHRNALVPIVLLIFAVCTTGMYWNEERHQK